MGEMADWVNNDSPHEDMDMREKQTMPKVGALWKADDGQVSGEVTCRHCHHRQKVALYPNGYKEKPTHPDYLLKGRGEPELDDYAATKAREAAPAAVETSDDDPLPF